MMVSLMCLTKKNRVNSLIVVICTMLFLSNCTRIVHRNDDKGSSGSVCIQQKKDTLFICGVTKIREQVWMSENLRVKTFRNGDSIKQVDLVEDWRYYTDKNMPVFMEIEIDTGCYNRILTDFTKEYMSSSFNPAKLTENANYFLYNQYAAVDNRILCPKGWKMPTKSDWQELVKFDKSDKHLLDTIGVVKSFGNKYGFSLRPTPFGFVSEEYDFQVSFAFFWMTEASKIMLNTLSYSEDDDFGVPSIYRWQESNKYDGCCVRCIKE